MIKIITRGSSTRKLLSLVERQLSASPRLFKVFKNCFTNTIKTTVEYLPDGTVFMVTGDIPAMWLRDSAAQIRPYLLTAKEDVEIRKIIRGVIKRQFFYILHDPYANAFNKEANGHGHQNDITDMSDWTWERKYEVDSLCYPIQLAYLYWKITGDTGHFDLNFQKAVREIIQVWKIEQNHGDLSEYLFQRYNCPATDTLSNGGQGAPTGETGMTWSGFRPSDDACTYGYLIPANIFAVTVLGYLVEIADRVLGDETMAAEVEELGKTIKEGVETYGKINHLQYGQIYAYETDGLGNYNIMDDANVPSLLSIPYLGYCSYDQQVYQNTRRFVLSSDNPYFFKGKAAEGIGSPHTPKGYIWHISLAMQGLTTPCYNEKKDMLDMMERTDGGTYFMHESFHCDDPDCFTRPWFSWANSLFCELVLDYCGLASEIFCAYAEQ